ncbi:MAG: sulfite exporter TauE/SafE family protein [Candidatus Methanoplasma sp.]|jgi:uncharacterized membrane protein YfcA|nr:sulfite exporter TauE/SafE family protein [Candidatus Methanoplasma sp.]
MDPVLIAELVVVGMGSGILGALFGIGGGIVFVPVLTVIFGLLAGEAVAVSLVGIIASSAGAASYYVGKGVANIRLGLLLEITTAVGAMVGAAVAAYIENWILLVIFAIVEIYSAASMIFVPERVSEDVGTDDALTFSYKDEKDGAVRRYRLGNLWPGTALCAAAGAMSSMTGVGGGTVKVPLMNILMHVPIRAASNTSNYMIGITAASGAIIYLAHGTLLPDYAAAIAIGALVGSYIGTRISAKLNASSMRRYFSVLLLVVAGIILLEAGGYI